VIDWLRENIFSATSLILLAFELLAEQLMWTTELVLRISSLPDSFHPGSDVIFFSLVFNDDVI
jgi:hypothetical protein